MSSWAKFVKTLFVTLLEVGYACLPTTQVHSAWLYKAKNHSLHCLESDSSQEQADILLILCFQQSTFIIPDYFVEFQLTNRSSKAARKQTKGGLAPTSSQNTICDTA
ncbi:uncharacterized [Tachysurus ichikawai]